MISALVLNQRVVCGAGASLQILSHLAVRWSKGAALASSERQQGSADASSFQQRVRQFRQDWKAKYGSDFDVQDESVVFSAATARSGGEGGSDGDADQALRQPGRGQASGGIE